MPGPSRKNHTPARHHQYARQFPHQANKHKRNDRSGTPPASRSSNGESHNQTAPSLACRHPAPSCGTYWSTKPRRPFLLGTPSEPTTSHLLWSIFWYRKDKRYPADNPCFLYSKHDTRDNFLTLYKWKTWSGSVPSRQKRHRNPWYPDNETALESNPSTGLKTPGHSVHNQKTDSSWPDYSNNYS